MHADRNRAIANTLLETQHTLQHETVWLSEDEEHLAHLRRSAAWRVLHVAVYGTVLLMAVFVVAMCWLGTDRNMRVELMFEVLLINLLCFLSGINWGVGLRYAAVSRSMPAFQFLWAPLPAYLAWPCLLLPSPWTFVALAALHTLSYRVEASMWASAGLSPWLPLRLHLCLGAVLASLAGAACVMFAS